MAWITLNRPEALNAFDSVMQRELRDLWAELRVNDDVRCIVLTGSGDRAFSTGLDRGEIQDIDELPPGKLPGYNTPWDFDDPGKSVCPKSNDLWKPVIAAVNGMACGGAFYILGEVDFIIAAEHATFFDPHVTYGMPTAFEPIFLLHKMPFQEVVRLSLLGAHERLSARRAYEVGLVSEVVPGDELRHEDGVGGRCDRRPAGSRRPGHGPGAVGRPRVEPPPGTRPCLPLHQHRHRCGQPGRGSGPVLLGPTDRLAPSLRSEGGQSTTPLTLRSRMASMSRPSSPSTSSVCSPCSGARVRSGGSSLNWRGEATILKTVPEFASTSRR